MADINRDNLIKKLDEYIEFLGKHYDAAYFIAHIHHYTEKEEDVKKGKQLRDEINELRSKIS